MSLLQRVLSSLIGLGSHTQDPGELAVRHMALQLAVVLVTAGVGSRIARRWLGQTPVMGQILAGLLLGPSALGALFPTFHAWLMPASSLPALNGLAQLGLVLLVFEVGLDIDFRSHLQGGGLRKVLVIGVSAFVTPLVVGFLVAPVLWRWLPAPRPDLIGFQLIFGCCLAITAVPVLGRIFHELGMSNTRSAALSIGSAALNDVLGWLVLGGIAAYVRSMLDPAAIIAQLLAITAGLAVAFALVGPILGRFLHAEIESSGGQLGSRAITWVLLVVCIASVISSLIGVFAVIGGLVIGIALHRQRALAEQWQKTISPLVHALFVPIFFTLTGLRTDVGQLSGPGAMAWCAGICLLAIATKIGSGYVAARVCGESQRVSLIVGVAMNTRGLMELVALGIGLELGILPRPVYTMLVLAAVVSTYVASPLLRRLLAAQAKLSVAPLSAGHITTLA